MKKLKNILINISGWILFIVFIILYGKEWIKCFDHKTFEEY